MMIVFFVERTSVRYDSAWHLWRTKVRPTLPVNIVLVFDE